MEKEEIKSTFNTALTINDRLGIGWHFVMINSIRSNFPEWASGLQSIGRELRHLMKQEEKEKFDDFCTDCDNLEREFILMMESFYDKNTDERTYTLRKGYLPEEYENYGIFKLVLREFDTFLRNIQERLDLGLAKKDNPKRAIAG